MPWQPNRYPPDWPAIVAAIRARAGNCCEWAGCRVPNGAIVLRPWRDPSAWQRYDGPAAPGARLRHGKVVRVVLTTAHLHNPDPGDCRPENLAYLCQLHHLRLDAPLHAQHAKAARQRRRQARSGQQSLPL